MTLDEAIKHAEEVAEKNERTAERIKNRPPYAADFGHETEKCVQCAQEHRQLAEWLRYLKCYRDEVPIVEIDDKLYVADNPKVKTVHGKTGEVVIGGFREAEIWDGRHVRIIAPAGTLASFDHCWQSGVYDGQACDLCPHGAECSGKEAEE